MTFHLTRRQIYDLIWSCELPQAAAHLGVSEWRIRQICDDHRVPMPSAAFWRDKSSGKRAKQAIFTTTMDDKLEVVTFHGDERTTPSPEPKKLSSLPLPPKPPQPKKHKTRGIEWFKVAHPHSALAGVARQLRSEKADEHGVVTISGDQTPYTAIGKPSVERAIFILDRIFRDLETRGIAIKLSRQWFTAVRGDETVDFKLTEKVAKLKHIPTDY